MIHSCLISAKLYSSWQMIFLLVMLKSESSWNFLCPSPKYQFFPEVFIDVPISCTFGGECLPAGRDVWGLCLECESLAKQGGWFLFMGLGERGDGLWWGVCFWLRASAVPDKPQLCLFDVNPALDILGCAWTQFCEHWEEGAYFMSVPINEKCIEVLGMRLAEIVTTL